VSPLLGEKRQNRPLSKLNTGRFALRAMLPVIKETPYKLDVAWKYRVMAALPNAGVACQGFR